MAKFNLGDVVMLRSGSVDMTVSNEEVFDMGNKLEDHIKCTFQLPSGKFETFSAHEDLFELVRATE